LDSADALKAHDEERVIITIDNVAQYLLDRGLLDTDSIVNGDLTIIDASRKNRNIEVIRNRGASLFIKQPDTTNLDAGKAIGREALLYLLIQTDPEFNSLKGLTPRALDFDNQRNILITEFIKNARSWNEHNYFVSKGAIRSEEAGVLGKSMATYHKAFDGLTDSNKLNFLPTGLLPFTSLSRPGPEIFTTMSSANLHLLKIVQQYSSLYDSLDQLSSEWHPQTLVHGDVKWDNILLSYEDPRGGLIKMTITDWETANLGDPAWDIGGIFQEFVRFWLSLLPITGTETPEQLVTSTAFPIKSMQPAVRAFWNAYTKFNSIGARRANELLVRSARFCAARLVQTAYESLYSSDALSNVAVYMTQIALNIFNNTDDAVIRLLGIPFKGDVF
jgi:hypothetical protein